MNELNSMWAELTQRLEIMSTRFDSSSAGFELTIMALGAFILGFLCFYLQGKARADSRRNGQ